MKDAHAWKTTRHTYMKRHPSNYIPISDKKTVEANHTNVRSHKWCYRCADEYTASSPSNTILLCRNLLFTVLAAERWQQGEMTRSCGQIDRILDISTIRSLSRNKKYIWSPLLDMLTFFWSVHCSRCFILRNEIFQCRDWPGQRRKAKNR